MFEFLQHIDLFFFKLINQEIANSFLDRIMVFITQRENWYLLYIALFVWLFWKGGREGKFFALALITAIVIGDQTASSLIKPFINKPRPCHTLSGDAIRLLVDCGGGRSFPSSHAVNNFAAAVMLSGFFKKYKLFFFTIASFIALSRVYVGVHYPVDVLGGAALGFFIGWGMLIVYRWLIKRSETKQ